MVNNDCSYGEYLFDDLLRTNSGAYRCLEKMEFTADLNKSDYLICEQKKYEECSIFIEKSKLIKNFSL